MIGSIGESTSERSRLKPVARNKHAKLSRHTLLCRSKSEKPNHFGITDEVFLPAPEQVRLGPARTLSATRMEEEPPEAVRDYETRPVSFFNEE